MRERKRLIRHVISDVTLIKAGEHITAHVRFAGGQADTINVPRPLRAWETHTTPPETLAVIDQLLAEHTHDEAVSILNARGLTGGWRKPFTVASLTALCKAHGVPTLRERLRAQGMLTVEETAHQLGVSTDTVAAWRRHGRRGAARRRPPQPPLPPRSRPPTAARQDRSRRPSGSRRPAISQSARRAVRRELLHRHPMASARPDHRRLRRTPRCALPGRAATPHTLPNRRRRASPRLPRPTADHRRSARDPAARRPFHRLQVVPARSHRSGRRGLSRPVSY